MLAIVAPGQGSQTPGFLTPWFEHFAGVPQIAEMVSHWSTLSGVDLKRLGTTADADEIRDTANAQPLLLLGALTGAGALFAGNDEDISVVAGHSVGEIAAATFAKILNADDAFTLVAARGREMAKAASITKTGMSAVLGGDREVVVKHLHSLGLTPANENGAGQIVAAGDLEALASLAESAPEGARVRPLQVAGAFHTDAMAPAVAAVSELASKTNVNDPQIRIVSNKEGAEVKNGREFLDRIIGQIAGPVRWDLCMDSLASMGVTGVIELPPAGTLVGLIKRAHPEIETFALKTPEDLDAAKEFVSKHK
jgi:[acyl-carrier-protein] S-malonyltransferase